MPEWFVPVLTLAGTALVVVGGVVGSILTNRVGKRAAANAAIAAQKTGENALIDQLQEELGRYRSSNDARTTEQDARMTRLDGLVDGYRAYIHELRAHIYDRKDPPPPAWPAHLPR